MTDLIYVSTATPNELTDLDNASIETVVQLYNERLPMLSKVKFVTPARVKRLAAVKKISPSFKTAQFWSDYFYGVSRDDFLTGRQPGSRWKADFDYLLSPAGFIKTLEKML